MSVKPQDMNRLMGTDAKTIFAVIVDRYGVVLADQIADEVIRLAKSGEARPTVVWPRLG